VVKETRGIKPKRNGKETNNIIVGREAQEVKT